MRKPVILITGALALLIVCASPSVHAADANHSAAQLRNLVRQDCGSCHGLSLKGGLGPSLRPERMQALGGEAIRLIIADGKPDTAMPPWRDLLTEQDIRHIAQDLLSGAYISDNTSTQESP
ncbi:cytochrome c [Hahella sp. KA22]|uniref:c-type cytochrome n=1 Tax=Hahella sp. KA22 TaxID=1628392 RepID=UPI000FDF1095|nr:cytochrome c [Hahella sp. KA22]AZZ93287.1 cytochrome c [Hahella sp. KA22]QAY56662.1 cytochrome c [Hahella sp. KA22]